MSIRLIDFMCDNMCVPKSELLRQIGLGFVRLDGMTAKNPAMFIDHFHELRVGQTKSFRVPCIEPYNIGDVAHDAGSPIEE